jgi:integrase
VNLGRLFEAPTTALRQAAGTNRLRESQATKASAALAVLLLLETAVRVGNLAAISLEHHLRAVQTRQGRRYHLSIPAIEVKNRESLHFPLSAELTELIDLYIERIRPKLLRRPHAFLFPGQKDGPKGAGLLSNQIASFMAQQVGTRMKAHKFRALVGYLYLKRHPSDYETVRRLLGHRDIATTVNFYVPLQQDEAVAAFERTIDELRCEVRAAGRRRR